MPTTPNIPGLPQVALALAPTAVLTVVLACASDPAHAQRTNEAIVLSDAIADLNSDQWSVRQRASEDLALLNLTLKQFEEVLRRNDLSPEQRERVAQLAFDRFRTTPRAAMGVGFAPLSPGVDGLPIATVHPPFDSVRVLRPGDILVSVAGVSTSGPAGARPSIISFDPGDEVEIGVRREGQLLTLSIKLGSFGDLRTTSPIDPGEHRAAWLLRLERIDKAASRTPEPRVPVPAAATVLHSAAIASALPGRIAGNADSPFVAPEGAARPKEARVYFALPGGSDRVVTSDSADRFRLTKVDSDFENALGDVARSVAQLQNQIRALEEALRVEPDARRRATITANLAQVRQMLRNQREKAREIEDAIALEQALQAQQGEQPPAP